MIKSVNGRFNVYSISPKIRQNLMHEGYESVKNDLLWLFFVHMKMSYYWFNRHKLLRKAKDRYNNGGGKTTLLNIMQKKERL